MPLLTMVFTDVVGSSATKRHPSLGRDNRERDLAYLGQVQHRHFELVRESCRDHQGKEVNTMGDAFFLAFDDPVQAIRCAIDVQRKLAAKPITTPQGPLRLRIGIHSGFPEFFEGSWHGTDVDTCARVEATASPGQILLSSRTYELVRHMTDASFHSKGQFALKGVEHVALWEVDWNAVGPRPTAVPPLDAGLRRKRILRSIAAALASLALLSCLGAYWYAVRQSNHVNILPRNRPSVAVMGFQNLGKPEAQWLSNALSEMLCTELGSTTTLRTISADDIANAKVDLAILGAPTFNSSTLAKIRRMIHAEYVVSGTYVALGNAPSDKIRMDVRLQDANSGETLASFAEEGLLAELSGVLRRIADDIRGHMGAESQSSAAQSASKSAFPSDPQAIQYYSDGLVKLRSFDALGAKSLFERSISLEPDFALPHFALAQTWSLMGYDQNARDECKQAIRLYANLPPVQQSSIEAFYRELNGEWDNAIDIYHSLSLLYPDEPNYALQLAGVQTRSGKGQQALATLDSLRSRPQSKDDPRVDLSEALAAESLSDAHKERDAAAAALEKANQQGSRLLAAHAGWQLCSAFLTLGELQKAEDSCKQSASSALFDDVIKARTQTVLASTMVAAGKIPEALEMRRQALETARKIGSQRDIGGALLNLASLQYSLGNAKEALENCQGAVKTLRAIDDKLDLTQALLSLGADFEQSGDFQKAGSTYQQAFDIAKESGDKGGLATSLLNLGNLQSRLGRLNDAQANIEKAIRIQNDAGMQLQQAAALNMLGEVLLIKADFTGARKNYESALDLSTKQNSPADIAASRAELASLNLEEGKYAEAESLARQAATEFASEMLVDNEADACNSLARAFLGQKKIPEARVELDHALKLSPRDPGISLALSISDARLKVLEGKVGDARKLLEDAFARASKLKLVGSSFQIRFSQAELESSANARSARLLFTALESDARSNGYLLIASQAESKRKQLS